jgi:hypothetical protein
METRKNSELDEAIMRSSEKLMNRMELIGKTVNHVIKAGPSD